MSSLPFLGKATEPKNGDLNGPIAVLGVASLGLEFFGGACQATGQAFRQLHSYAVGVTEEHKPGLAAFIRT